MHLAFLLLQSNAPETAKGVYSILATPIMILLVVLALGALMRTLSIGMSKYLLKKRSSFTVVAKPVWFPAAPSL